MVSSEIGLLSDRTLLAFRITLSTAVLIAVTTRGRGGLTHHLQSEASAGNRKMAMTFAK